MKKLLTALLAIATAVSLTACGNSQSENNSETSISSITAGLTNSQSSTEADNTTASLSDYNGIYTNSDNGETITIQGDEIIFNGTSFAVESTADNYFILSGSSAVFIIDENSINTNLSNPDDNSYLDTYIKDLNTVDSTQSQEQAADNDLSEEDFAWNLLLTLDGTYSEEGVSTMVIENGVISVHVEDFNTREVYGDFVISKETGGYAYYSEFENILDVSAGGDIDFSMRLVLDSVEYGYLQSEMYVNSEYLGGYIFMKKGGVADENSDNSTDGAAQTDDEQRFYYCSADPSTLSAGMYELFADLTYNDGIYQLSLGYGNQFANAVSSNWYVTFTSSGQTEVSYEYEPGTGYSEERDTVTMTLTDGGMHLKLVNYKSDPAIVNEFDMTAYPIG